MSHEKAKRVHTQFDLEDHIEREQYDEEELPETSSRPSVFGDEFLVTKSRKDKQAEQKLKNQEKQELKAAEKKKELQRAAAAAAAAAKEAQFHDEYVKLRDRVIREANIRYVGKLRGTMYAEYKDDQLTDAQREPFICPICGQYDFPPHDPNCWDKFSKEQEARRLALYNPFYPRPNEEKHSDTPKGGYRNKSIKKNKYNKKRKSLCKINKHYGGECEYTIRISEPISAPPEDKINIRNKCYKLSDLYDWAITKGNKYLPKDELTDRELSSLKKSHELNTKMKQVIPTNILDKENIERLISGNPENIENMLIQQYSHIHQYNIDIQDYVINGFKRWSLQYYNMLKTEINLIRNQYRDVPITIVSIGNSPYKFLRLIELFGYVDNSNFIYLPYSGNFTKLDTETGMRKVLQMKDLEAYLTDPDKFLFLNYQGPRSKMLLKHFENILSDSGLLQNIRDNHKIIFVDFLQSGLGSLSFMITIDKYLKPENTLFLALENPKANSHPNKSESIVLTDTLMLNKYPVKFIDLDYDDKIFTTFFIDDDVSSDRCVKSYKKEVWKSDNKPYWDENMLFSCNIALLNMALTLRQSGSI